MYKYMYEASHSADIVFCGYDKFYSDKIEQSDVMDKLKLFQEGKKYKGIEIYRHELVTVWNKIYRKDFLKENNFKFIEGIIHEDDEFSLKVFTIASDVKFIKRNFYFYRLDNLNSITKSATRFVMKSYDMLKVA
ncbi:MAG: hypothetical protein ACRC6A_00280 [Fusobacteriaceae bacterium]